MKRRDAPKMLMAGLAVPSLLSLHPVFGTVHKRAVNPSKRPNIILILADDLGYSQISCYGNRFIETPRFNRARVGASAAPKPIPPPRFARPRAALMTGQHPARQGKPYDLAEYDEYYLGPVYITINERLKSPGYVTGLVGKWHLAGDYDKNFGAPGLHNWDELILSEIQYIAPAPISRRTSSCPRWSLGSGTST